MYTKQIPHMGANFETWEAWIIEQTLEIHAWNITETAKTLRLGRATMHRLMNKYNIKK